MIKMKSLSLALVCVIAISAFTSCAKNPLLPAGDSSTPSSQSAVAKPSKPAGYYENDKIVELGTVLTIGDVKVSFDEFRYAFMNIATSLAAEGEVNEADLKEQCVAFFKERAAIRAIATENGITLSEEDTKLIKENIATQRTSAGSEEEYNEALAQNFLTEDVIATVSEPQILIGKFAQLRATTTHKDAIMKNVADNFVHVKHVLIQFPDGKQLTDLTEEEIKATLDKANDVIKKINEGMTFEDAVKEFNEDPGQTEDGYSFTKGEMEVNFETKSFELKVGEMSEPVQTSYGYHIIKKYEFDTSAINDTNLIQYASDEIYSLLDAEIAKASDALEITYCKEWDKISTATLY